MRWTESQLNWIWEKSFYGDADQTLEQVSQTGHEVSILERSKPDWKELQVACSTCSCFLNRIGIDHLQVSLPTSAILWFWVCVKDFFIHQFLIGFLEYKHWYSSIYFLGFSEPAVFLSVAILKAWVFPLLLDWSVSKGCAQDVQERLVEVFIRTSLPYKETEN